LCLPIEKIGRYNSINNVLDNLHMSVAKELKDCIQSSSRTETLAADVCDDR